MKFCFTFKNLLSPLFAARASTTPAPSAPALEPHTSSLTTSTSGGELSSTLFETMAPAILLDNLTLAYPDANGVEVPLLDRVSVTFDAGKVTTLIGESGCGKTTLLKALANLIQPQAGSIHFVAERVLEVTEPPLEKLDDPSQASHPSPRLHTPNALISSSTITPRIGFVFQEPRLFPWLTVAENVALAVRALPSDLRAERVVSTLEAVRMAPYANHYPEALSGGMAQRVGLARALVSEPTLLLLDEPFSALDALTRGRLQDELRHLMATRSMTTVMVTHDVSEAVYLSDTIYRLDRGVLKEREVITLAQPRERHHPELLEATERITARFFAP